VWTEHAGGWGTPAGKSMAVPDAPAPRPNDLTFVLQTHEAGGQLFGLVPYTLYKAGAEVAKGITDAKGQVLIKDHKKGTAAYTVKLANGTEFEVPVKAQLADGNAEQALSNAGVRGGGEALKHRLKKLLRLKPSA
jgi:type VI secretion system secreted protein VgrG